MNKFIRRLAVVLLAGLVPLSALVGHAQAAVSGVARFDGDAPPLAPWEIGGTVYDIRTGLEITDFFGEITKELMPGDTRTFSVRLTNNTAFTVEFFLRAAPVTHDPATSFEGETSDDLTASGSDFDDKSPLIGDALLDAVTLTILNPFAPTGSPPLYEGAMRGNSADPTSIYSRANVNGIALGYVGAHAVGLIQVTVDIPRELGDEYQDAFAAVEWIFYAQYDDTTPTPTPTLTPTPTPPVSPTPPEESLPPESGPPASGPPVESGPPATPTPPEETLSPSGPPIDPPGPDDDYDVIVTPTGDDQNIFTWATLASISLVGLTVILILTIRKERKEKKARR